MVGGLRTLGLKKSAVKQKIDGGYVYRNQALNARRLRSGQREKDQRQLGYALYHQGADVVGTARLTCALPLERSDVGGRSAQLR